MLNTLHWAGATSVLRRRKKHHLTVLSLHRISDECNFFWNPIRPKTFEKLLKYVKKNYEVIRFDELLEKQDSEARKPLLILSFDDGYHDFFEYALPLLHRYGVPANHNIVNACANDNIAIWTHRLNGIFDHARNQKQDLRIDLDDRTFSRSDLQGSWWHFYLQTFQAMLGMEQPERDALLGRLESSVGTKVECRMMNWEEIRQCSQMGVEIGSHSYNHDSLANLTDKKSLEKEVNRSKDEIEAHIGMPVTVFALPNGQSGDPVEKQVDAAGFAFNLLANDELNRLPVNMDSKAIRVNRINLVDEPWPQMALRVEQFHKLVRRHA